jgi:hypothetical protein
VFYFTECFLRDTRQRASLPSARKKHSAKNMTLGKEPNSGSASAEDEDHHLTVRERRKKDSMTLRRRCSRFHRQDVALRTYVRLKNAWFSRTRTFQL